MLYRDHMYEQQQSCPSLISPYQPPLVDRHYSSPASYSEPIQQPQYQQGYQYPTKAFSGANLFSSDTHSIRHGEATKQTQHVPVNHLSYPNSSIQSSPSSTGHNYVQSTDIPHQLPPMKYPSQLGYQSNLSQSQLHQVEYGVSPTNQYVSTGTSMLSSSLPPAFTIAQSIGKNSQSSVEHESLVITPQYRQYPMNTVSAQSQPSTPQSRRHQYFNTGHSSSFPPHIPILSYPNTTQQSPSGVLPYNNLILPPQVPDLQSHLQSEQLPKLSDLKPHDEFIQPSRHNPPAHFSDHSSHSPERMSTYSDNPTTRYDTEAVMQGSEGNTHT